MRRRFAARHTTLAGAGIAAAGVLLAGCGGHQPPPAAVSQGPQPEAAAQGDGGTERATASARQGISAPAAKPSAPMVLRYELLDEPRAGQPLHVRVTVTPRRDVGALTLEAQGADALVLTPPPYEAPVDLRAGESMSRELTVVPVQQGRHRLRVVAQGIVNGELQAAGLIVPVVVGEEPPAPNARAEAQAERGGERLRSLPAEERDRQ